MTPTPSPVTANRRERWLHVAGVAIVLAALLLVPVATRAQNYLFSVPSVVFQVFVQPDGSARLVYDIEFENLGSTIDIVDIGVPTKDYQLSNFSASIDGLPLDDIRPSEYVKPGVEVHLDSGSIPSGQSGTLHVEFTMPDMVYQDLTSKDLASLQITPTWFDSQFVSGTTNLEIAVHLPEGISIDELKWQDTPYSQTGIVDDRAVAVWLFNDTSFTGPEKVGISFPKDVMTNIIDQNLLQLTALWYENSSFAQIVTGLVLLVAFSIIFFRITGATGFFLWLLMCGGIVWFLINRPLAGPLLVIPTVLLAWLAQSRYKKRRMRKYLPAIAQVEGGGIKRGLTAPEAAALLELPLNKVLTLIIFGLLKKGALRQIKASPLTVELAPDFVPAAKDAGKSAKAKQRKDAAQTLGVALHTYEQSFLDVIEKHPNKPLKEIDFDAEMKAFLTGVAARMKGFDTSDTVEYYQAIVKRAVEQAKAIEDIGEREKALDKDMEWILMDDQAPNVWDTPTYHYSPIWIRPTAGGSGGGGVSLGGGGSSTPAPSFGDVSRGFAGWTENTAGSLAAAISPASLPGGAGGVINLAGVDRGVSKVLSSSGGSSGGGGGGSCACACAGCACACACAGGGR